MPDHPGHSQRGERPDGAPAPDPWAAPAPATPTDLDDVDPELLALPAPRRRRNPIISAAVIGLAAYLMWFTRADLLYYFEPAEPRDLGEASEAVARGAIRVNTYVRVRGAPDRKHALILERRFRGYDSFFRLQGTRSRLFVQRPRHRRTTERAVPLVHTGRVRRFTDMPYRKQVADYYARAVTRSHDLGFDAVVAALREGKRSVTLTDSEGEKVPLRPDTVVWINVTYPGELVVQFARRAYPDPAVAEARLRPLGLPFAPDTEPSRTFRRYVVLARTPAERARVEAAFRDRSLNAGVVPRQVSFMARWDQLRAGAGGLLLIDAEDESYPSRFQREEDGAGARLVARRPGRPVRLSRDAVRYITVSSPFNIPADALVLVAGEEPGDGWTYLALWMLLGAFIVLNALALLSWVRSAAGR